MDHKTKLSTSLCFWDISMPYSMATDAAYVGQLLVTCIGDHRLLSELLLPVAPGSFAMQILQTSSDFPGEMHGDDDLDSKHQYAAVHHSKCSVAAGTSGTTHELQYDLQTETFVVISL